MKKIRFFVVSSILIAALNLLAAQTLEEQYLKPKELKLRTYYYQVKSGGRDTKLEILEKLINEFDEENYSKDDAMLMDIVSYLAEEGSLRKEFENNMLVNNFPDVRKAAVEVLGKIGGDEARDILITILINDPNETVKAEVCEALASDNIGDNESGEALSAIIYVYRKTYNPGQKFVMAIISAVRKIAKPDTDSYADAIYILSEIQLGNYNRFIRKAAYDAINELSGGQ